MTEPGVAESAQPGGAGETAQPGGAAGVDEAAGSAGAAGVDEAAGSAEAAEAAGSAAEATGSAGAAGVDEAAGSAEATESGLDRQIAELRRRHLAITAYTTTKAHWWPTKAEEWAADMWRYDTSLVATAELLGLSVPPQPPPDAMRRLSPAERAGLERRLADAGIDLG